MMPFCLLFVKHAVMCVADEHAAVHLWCGRRLANRRLRLEACPAQCHVQCGLCMLCLVFVSAVPQFRTVIVISASKYQAAVMKMQDKLAEAMKAEAEAQAAAATTEQ